MTIKDATEIFDLFDDYLRERDFDVGGLKDR